MRATRRRLFILLAAISVLFSSAPTSAGPPDNGDASAFDQKLQDELRFRRDFGLNTDVAAVSALMADPTAYTTYPVALTPGERAEMDRRIAMESQMTQLEEAAEKLPGFAGHWIDQPAGGIIMVAYTDGPEMYEEALRALVPEGATMLVVKAARTQVELEALLDRIWADRRDLALSGVQIGHLRVHLPTNRVVVGVHDLTAASEAALYQRYGDAVRAEISNPGPTGCSVNNTNCWGPPLRAGVSGAPVGTAQHDWCSIAFLVRHNASGNKGWLTAGHCAKPPAIGSVWHHAANPSWPMGTIMATCYPYCWYSDAARADICCTALISKIVYKHGNPNGRTVTGSQDDVFSDPGDYVCLNARMNVSWRCGYITSIGRMTFQDGTWFDLQRFASYQVYYGDSGGAVHSAESGYPNYTVTAYGVHSGCTNLQGDVCYGEGTFSHIDLVSQELGITVCSTTQLC